MLTNVPDLASILYIIYCSKLHPRLRAIPNVIGELKHFLSFHDDPPLLAPLCHPGQ